MNINENTLKIINEYIRGRVGEVEFFKMMPVKSFNEINKEISKDLKNFKINSNRLYININDVLQDSEISSKIINIGEIRKSVNDYKNYKIDKIPEYLNLIYNQWIDLSPKKDHFKKEKDIILNNINENIKPFIEIIKDFKEEENKGKNIFENLESLLRMKEESISENNEKNLNRANKAINKNVVDIRKKEVALNDILSGDSFKNLNDNLKMFEKMLSNIKLTIPKDIIYNQSESILSKYDKNNELSQFMLTKNIDNNLLDTIKLTKAQYFENIYILKDKSIIVKTKEGYKTPKTNGQEYKEYFEKVSDNIVEYSLRKKPTLINDFKELLHKENYNINGCIQAMNSFIQNETILRNYDFNIKENLKDTTLEILDDQINAIKNKHSIRQLAHSITSNKYKHLYNEKTYDLFGELFESKVSEKIIQENIGKKVASLKTPEELNKTLEKFINFLNNFSHGAISSKAFETDSQSVYDFDNILILKVNDFETSNKLGSTSWCISRQKHYFNSYVTEEGNYQFFIYDFNKDAKNNESMIGITLHKDGTHEAAHLKDDRELSSSDKLYTDLRNIIISNNLNLFKELDKEIKYEINELSEKNTAPSMKI